MKAKERWQQANAGKEACRDTYRAFFISLGARFGRIRKRPKGHPSPQLYDYKKEKLQELEQQSTGKVLLASISETGASLVPKDMCHTAGSSPVKA